MTLDYLSSLRNHLTMETCAKQSEYIIDCGNQNILRIYMSLVNFFGLSKCRNHLDDSDVSLHKRNLKAKDLTTTQNNLYSLLAASILPSCFKCLALNQHFQISIFNLDAWNLRPPFTYPFARVQIVQPHLEESIKTILSRSPFCPRSRTLLMLPFPNFCRSRSRASSRSFALKPSLGGPKSGIVPLGMNTW